MKIEIDALRVEERESVSLAERPTRVEPLYHAEAGYEEALARHAAKLEALHERLYATGRHALLIILQGMDCAGKDGAIRHVMSGVNPQGCKVASFKTPTPVEARHDFLWRAALELPERGAIAVFNRSYYEAVLIERVHPEYLASEGVFVALDDLKALFDQRLRSIRDFERHLTSSGTKIVKIFLHLSKDEQRKRLLARLEDPEKAWKATPSDAAERRFWEDYQHAHEAMLGASSTRAAPWHIVPADGKKNARLFVSQIIIEALRSLPLDPPPLSAARRRELEEIRASLKA